MAAGELNPSMQHKSSHDCAFASCWILACSPGLACTHMYAVSAELMSSTVEPLLGIDSHICMTPVLGMEQARFPAGSWTVEQLCGIESMGSKAALQMGAWYYLMQTFLWYARCHNPQKRLRHDCLYCSGIQPAVNWDAQYRQLRGGLPHCCYWQIRCSTANKNLYYTTFTQLQ